MKSAILCAVKLKERSKKMPQFSTHFENIKPSAIRLAQIEFEKRTDSVKAINTAIGNVSLPMHPAMIERMKNLDGENSPFKDGIVRYTTTRGLEETNKAFMNIIAASGFETKGLYSQITNGGSQAMGLVILGVCGDAGTDDRPLLLIDAAYTNYGSFAKRLGRKTISISRTLNEDGSFTLPEFDEIEDLIKEYNPGALVVIPYDNPTGQFYSNEQLAKLAELCIKYDMWMISDEAYRELYYVDGNVSSVWGLSEESVPGISGRRISIESVSKVWNACGARIGALVTDNELFSERAVAENTAELCSPAIEQYIFGALAEEPIEKIQNWFDSQREYYKQIGEDLLNGFKNEMPDLIVSRPEASIYSVVDVRNITEEFDALDFVTFCATHGSCELDGQNYTLLVAPMAGFYTVDSTEKNPGLTQMRIAYVESQENMKKVPKLFSELLSQYLNK